MKRLQKNYLSLSDSDFGITFLRPLLICALVFIMIKTKAQVINYVNNPSFEMVSPTATASLFDTFEFWGPIDSLNCNSYYIEGMPPLGNAPYCSTGFQYPRTGRNFILTSFFCDNCVRWYPRNKLKQKLKSNTAYCAKYFVVNTNNDRIAIDTYGMYVGDGTMDTISQCQVPLTYLTPQVEHPSGNIITDTLNWIPITGTFVANGTEKYLLLGNFRSNPATHTLLINTPTLTTMSNDNYIDDVSLIELNLPAFAGRDTAIVPGDSIYLGRESDIGIDDDCMWYKLPTVITPTTPAIDTIAGFWIKPITTVTYVVRQEICGLVKWDTVTIYMNPVGLEKLKMITEELKIYPVPAHDFLELRISNEDLIREFEKFYIYNNLGQLLREEEIQFKDKKITVKTNDLAEGVYFIQLKSDNTGIVSKKFVISR
jgi:hypothetical protein